MENYLLLDSSGANLWSRVRHASSRMNISIDISDENKYSLIVNHLTFGNVAYNLFNVPDIYITMNMCKIIIQSVIRYTYLIHLMNKCSFMNVLVFTVKLFFEYILYFIFSREDLSLELT